MEFKLIIKKLNNTLTEKESIVFLEWYNESDLHKKYFNKVKENYQDDTFLIDVEKGWKSIKSEIKPASSNKTNYLKYAVAASIVLLVSITFLFNQGNNEEITIPIIVNNNIKAGTDKATLTLEDGTDVILEKGESYIASNIASNGEEIIYNNTSTTKPEIAYNYLTIPRGGQYFVKLSDGTQVWLNSETKLKYPVNFIDGNSREVELVYGEAYFDVSPSEKHNGSKFIVSNQMQEIEVLGTEFNIKAYQDEEYIYTTLVEGRVSLYDTNTYNILTPNQQCVLSKIDSQIEINNVDVFNAIAWKNGIFSFEDMPLEEIAKVLSRWYKVDMIFLDTNLKDIRFTGVLRKNQNIEEILQPIKTLDNIAYEIKNNTVIFK